jgi:hypothetical protein
VEYRSALPAWVVVLHSVNVAVTRALGSDQGNRADAFRDRSGSFRSVCIAFRPHATNSNGVSIPRMPYR